LNVQTKVGVQEPELVLRSCCYGGFLMRQSFKVILIVLGLLCLAACNEVAVQPPVIPPVTPPPTEPVTTPVVLGDTDSHYSLTVRIRKDDLVAETEAKYKGKVVVWRPDEKFAILALNKTTGDQLETNGGIATLETNKKAFLGSGQLATMSGSIAAWAGGSIAAWAGGSIAAWAGGNFSLVPLNTAKWQILNLQQAQTLATNLGAGITVAVIDSGIDLQHPAFANAFVPSSDMWDYVGNDAVPQEEGALGTDAAFGHGTSVAGIILQIAPKAKILPLRVLGPDGSGDVLNVAAAINRAMQAGAKIINLSLGSDTNSQAVNDAISAAALRGIFVISSSGNTNNQNVTFPANQANVDTTLIGQYSLSVSSVDANDDKSSFSTWGTSVAPLEISAPGEQVFGPVPGNKMGAWSGTSMSAPMVSATLALALGQNSSLNLADLTTKLKDTAENIYKSGKNAEYKVDSSDAGGSSVRLLGEGRLDINNFLISVVP
jgi:thermitase